MRARKQILKASLQGIAELHDREVVHLGKFSHFCTHKAIDQELNLFRYQARQYHGQFLLE